MYVPGSALPKFSEVQASLFPVDAALHACILRLLEPGYIYFVLLSPDAVLLENQVCETR